jgi:hypothetical protein
MSKAYIYFYNEPNCLRIYNSKTNGTAYVSKENIIIEYDSKETLILKNNDYIKQFEYFTVAFPKSVNLMDLAAKIVKMMQQSDIHTNALHKMSNPSSVYEMKTEHEKTDPFQRYTSKHLQETRTESTYQIKGYDAGDTLVAMYDAHTVDNELVIDAALDSLGDKIAGHSLNVFDRNCDCIECGSALACTCPTGSGTITTSYPSGNTRTNYCTCGRLLLTTDTNIDICDAGGCGRLRACTCIYHDGTPLINLCTCNALHECTPADCPINYERSVEACTCPPLAACVCQALQKCTCTEHEIETNYGCICGAFDRNMTQHTITFADGSSPITLYEYQCRCVVNSIGDNSVYDLKDLSWVVPNGYKLLNQGCWCGANDSSAGDNAVFSCINGHNLDCTCTVEIEYTSLDGDFTTNFAPATLLDPTKMHTPPEEQYLYSTWNGLSHIILTNRTGYTMTIPKINLAHIMCTLASNATLSGSMTQLGNNLLYQPVGFVTGTPVDYVLNCDLTVHDINNRPSSPFPLFWIKFNVVLAEQTSANMHKEAQGYGWFNYSAKYIVGDLGIIYENIRSNSAESRDTTAFVTTEGVEAKDPSKGFKAFEGLAKRDTYWDYGVHIYQFTILVDDYLDTSKHNLAFDNIVIRAESLIFTEWYVNPGTLTGSSGIIVESVPLTTLCICGSALACICGLQDGSTSACRYLDTDTPLTITESVDSGNLQTKCFCGAASSCSSKPILTNLVVDDSTNITIPIQYNSYIRWPKGSLFNSTPIPSVCVQTVAGASYNDYQELVVSSANSTCTYNNAGIATLSTTDNIVLPKGILTIRSPISTTEVVNTTTYKYMTKTSMIFSDPITFSDDSGQRTYSFSNTDETILVDTTKIVNQTTRDVVIHSDAVITCHSKMITRTTKNNLEVFTSNGAFKVTFHKDSTVARNAEQELVITTPSVILFDFQLWTNTQDNGDYVHVLEITDASKSMNLLQGTSVDIFTHCTTNLKCSCDRSDFCLHKINRFTMCPNTPIENRTVANYSTDGFDDEIMTPISVASENNENFPLVRGGVLNIQRKHIEQSKEYLSVSCANSHVCLITANLLKELPNCNDIQKDARDSSLIRWETNPTVFVKDAYANVEMISNSEIVDPPIDRSEFLEIKSKVGMFCESTDIVNRLYQHHSSKQYDSGIYIEYTKNYTIDDGDMYDIDDISPDIKKQMSLVLKSNGNEIRIPQQQFNIDRLDGSGTSEYTLDPTEEITFVFQYGSIANGEILFGVMNAGTIIIAHEFEAIDIGIFNFDIKYPIRWDFEINSSIRGFGFLSAASRHTLMRGKALMYSSSTNQEKGDMINALIPCKKLYTASVDANGFPDSNQVTFQKLDFSHQIFCHLTAEYNKNLLFSIRLADAHTRKKIMLKSITFISNDSNSKTFKWKIIRNGSIRKSMWRLNIPELIMSRNSLTTYTNMVLADQTNDPPIQDLQFVTPNDMYLHKTGCYPVYIYDNIECDQYGAISGNYDYINEPLKISEVSNLSEIYKQIPISICEIFSENMLVYESSSEIITTYTTLPGKGSFYSMTEDNEATIIYDDSTSPQTYGYNTFDISINSSINISHLYDIHDGDLIGEGIVIMTKEKTVDLSFLLPILANVEGESDQFSMMLEHTLGESISVQGMLNWEEY